MPLRPEVSDSEISKLNHECIVNSVRRLRTHRGSKRLMKFVSPAVMCLLVFTIPAVVMGQDVKPPATEAEKTGSEKTTSGVGGNQSGTSGQSATEANSSAKGSEQEAAQVDPSQKTVAEAASTKTTIREINLLEKGLAESWNYFSSDGTTELADAWVLKSVDEQQQLICRGNPKGFLYTKAQHSNFRLSFEWKYITDPDSNSGVLIYTQKEPRLWPTAMQVQLHQPLAGCIFPGGDATSDNSTEAQELAREIGEWNSCLIVSEGGKLSVEINGRKAGEVSGCMPSTGFIALQAEGSETHFRKLMLQVLPPPEAAPAVTVEAPAAAKIEALPKEAGEIKSISDDDPKAKPINFDG